MECLFAGDWMVELDLSKIKKWGLISLSIWISILILIQITAAFVILEEMPEACLEESENCSRLAHDETSYRHGDLKPLSLETSLDEATEFVEEWFDNRWFSSSTTKLEGNKTLIHGVDRTEFWLFPDDVHIELVCIENRVNVTIHSESRLGLGDLGENQRRLEKMHSDFSEESWSDTSC